YDFEVGAGADGYTWIKVKTRSTTDGYKRRVDVIELYNVGTGKITQLLNRCLDSNWGVDCGYGVLKLEGDSETFWTQKFGDSTHLNEVSL
ncbi:MAG: hypothetical protein ACXQS4_04845, partial [Methermicoccaceae archaeon]